MLRTEHSNKFNDNLFNMPNVKCVISDKELLRGISRKYFFSRNNSWRSFLVNTFWWHFFMKFMYSKVFLVGRGWRDNTCYALHLRKHYYLILNYLMPEGVLCVELLISNMIYFLLNSRICWTYLMLYQRGCINISKYGNLCKCNINDVQRFVLRCKRNVSCAVSVY